MYPSPSRSHCLRLFTIQFRLTKAPSGKFTYLCEANLDCIASVFGRSTRDRNLRSRRQVDAEAGATAGLAIHLNRAAVLQPKGTDAADAGPPGGGLPFGAGGGAPFGPPRPRPAPTPPSAAPAPEPAPAAAPAPAAEAPAPAAPAPAPLPAAARAPVVPGPAQPAQRDFAKADYLAAVLRAKDLIAGGDFMQVQVGQRIKKPYTAAPLSLYRALRSLNPSPYMYYYNFSGASADASADFHVVGASPEILVRVRDGEVTIRPIAGTRWRGKTPVEDEALAAELLADPKERSEHLMLLDLGRNDVGRVSKIGTVEVTAKFFIERYSHVMHIVSNVVGQLDPAHDEIDALCAGFPAGTVSGAPKVRAMEIIDELETDRRGIYGGCIGYFGASGEMDTCIVLRTAIIKDSQMHAQAGAGIVYDSVPVSEHRECVNKAQALFRAAEEAVRFATSARRGQ